MQLFMLRVSALAIYLAAVLAGPAVKADDETPEELLLGKTFIFYYLWYRTDTSAASQPTTVANLASASFRAQVWKP